MRRERGLDIETGFHNDSPLRLKRLALPCLLLLGLGGKRQASFEGAGNLKSFE
jgi:hypothetical protein